MEAPPGLRPRWLTVVLLVVVGQLLALTHPYWGAVASESLRALAPVLLGALSRRWLDRVTSIAIATGAAAHAALVLMLLVPAPFVGDAVPEDALSTAILLARVFGVVWMVLYVRRGLRPTS